MYDLENGRSDIQQVFDTLIRSSQQTIVVADMCDFAQCFCLSHAGLSDIRNWDQWSLAFQRPMYENRVKAGTRQLCFAIQSI